MSYLHMFRRKPAITRSDWHFTASLNSSENYATFTRSIHSSLKIKIWSREDHLASGLIEVTYPTLYLVNNNFALAYALALAMRKPACKGIILCYYL